MSVKSMNKNNNPKSSDYYIIEDQKNYNSDNSRIQEVMDNANSGSTIEFKGSSYKNLYLNINKPFNIISKSNTIITNYFNTPAFTINKDGSGTTISGFTVNLASSFVDSKSASNIIISNNKISTTETGICFNNVHNSKISNNEFLSFKTAISIQKSGDISITKNNITSNKKYSIGIDLKDNNNKNGINILDNNIIGIKDLSEIGINIDNNVQYVTIKRNIISNWNVGINFVNSATNTDIENNTISKNYNGLVINGWLDNFSFTKNTVTNSYDEGILFDYDFLGTKDNHKIENNFFSDNKGLDMRSPGTNGLDIGKNFAKNLCSKIKMYGDFYIKTLQNGNKYIFSVTDHMDRNIGGLPNFSATMDINGIKYNVAFKEGVGYLEANDNSNSENPTLYVGDYKNSLNKWGSFDSVGSDEFGEYLEKYFGYSNNKESNKNKDNTNASSNSEINSGKSGTNSGNQGSSPSSGNSYVSSNTATPSSSSSPSSSISSGSLGTPTTEDQFSSDSNSDSTQSSNSPSTSSTNPSSSSSQSSTSVAKQLSVDEENFKVAGVGGLILLIVLVIGMYYREDFFEMVGNN